jgi:glycerol-3-phosphate dehydrogenase (NAD(P)+)
MIENKKIAVIGGGSWATAIVKILSENNNTLNWWLRNTDDVNYILQYKHNPRYLSDVEIDLNKIKPNNNLDEVISNSDIVVFAIPAAFLPSALEKTKKESLNNKLIVSAIKGMIPDEHVVITDYFTNHFKIPAEQVAVVGGPCHAEEVAMEKQSYLTIACSEIKNAELLCELFSCRFIKASPITDVYGVEYSAVMKNIQAIACGIAHGLGYGDNFQSVLVSNALQEMSRFLDAISPMKRDICASVYAGDLLVTAYSQFSRNRTFGNMLGRGYSVKSAQIEMNMIAEGYFAVKSINEINKKLKVEMPITSTVYHIIYDRNSPMLEMRLLKEQLI